MVLRTVAPERTSSCTLHAVQALPRLDAPARRMRLSNSPDMVRLVGRHPPSASVGAVAHMKAGSIAVAAIAVLLFAGPARAAVSAPSVTSAHTHTLVTTAHAVHTGVHAAHRHHRVHRAHGHAAVRASIARAASTPVAPAPALPVHHPARHPAVLPHVAAKVMRAPSRGTHPGALGQASPGLGPATDQSSFSAIVNDRVSDPHHALLRGRSPPRGDPPSATSPASSRAPAALHLRAPALHAPVTHGASATLADCTADSPLRSIVLARQTPFAEPFDRDAARLVRSPCFTHPDRAFEGKPAGSISPSWRIST